MSAEFEATPLAWDEWPFDGWREADENSSVLQFIVDAPLGSESCQPVTEAIYDLSKNATVDLLLVARRIGPFVLLHELRPDDHLCSDEENDVEIGTLIRSCFTLWIDMWSLGYEESAEAIPEDYFGYLCDVLFRMATRPNGGVAAKRGEVGTVQVVDAEEWGSTAGHSLGGGDLDETPTQTIEVHDSILGWLSRVAASDVASIVTVAMARAPARIASLAKRHARWLEDERVRRSNGEVHAGEKFIFIAGRNDGHLKRHSYFDLELQGYAWDDRRREDMKAEARLSARLIGQSLIETAARHSI
ncbi:hypothetical protein [Variovorax gossypii]|jgi:hypothetical protein